MDRINYLSILFKFITNRIMQLDRCAITVVFSGLILCVTIPVCAQNTVSLKQAIDNGLLNRKNIIAGKIDISISKLQTEALYRKYWPQVSADYSYLYNPILQTSILPIGIFNPSYPTNATKSVQFGTKWSQSVGLNINQSLLDLSIQKNINKAKLQEQIAVASQAQSEYILVYTIAQAYIAICLQESKIKSAIADTNRTFSSFQLLKNKFEEKRLLKSDLNKAKVNHNNSVQRYTNTISQLIEYKVYLLYLMGTNDIEKSDFATDTNFVKKQPLDKPDSTSISEHIPALQQLTLQSQLTFLQAKLEKAKYMPTVNLKGFLGANQFTNTFQPTAENSWFGLSYIGLDAKFPLLTRDHQHHKLQELKLQSNQYDLQKEDKAALYNKDAFTSKLLIENVKSQLKTQAENLVLSKESIHIIQERVLQGQETATTLNLEEANLQILESEYETNQRQLWVNWLNYLNATGQLFELNK